MKQFNKVRTTLTLDPPIHEYFQKLADKEERSVSWLINKALTEYVKMKEGK